MYSRQIVNNSNPQKCVLQCRNAKYFFDFPEEDIFRNLWLYKLGLEQCEETSKVCDKHFSACMLCPENKYKLAELAVPDKKLPSSSIKKKEIYDKLITKLSPTDEKTKRKTASTDKKQITTSSVNKPEPAKNLPTQFANCSPTFKKQLSTSSGQKVQPAKNLSTPVTNGSMASRPTESLPPTTSSWLNDSSNLLMDYQLRIQGRHMCDVIELPEYIVVFTVVKPKELNTLPRTGLIQRNSKENINPLLLSIPPTITVTRTDPKGKSTPIDTITIDDNEDEKKKISTTAQVQKEPEIEYVYYMTEKGEPRREREVQVDIPNETRETAIQCDLQLENDLIQMSYIPRLYWEHGLSAEEVNMQECLVCGEILHSYVDQRRHAIEHEKTTLLCSHCGEVFSNRLKLKAHKKKVRSENELEIKKALRCPKLHCKKAFHSRKQLNNHIDQHINKTEYKCNKCLRLFPSSLKLHIHQKSFKNCLKSRWPKAQRWNWRRK